MGDLTKNFSRHEFTCHCGCGADFVQMRLVLALQRMRDILGAPLSVNSGYRCRSHNHKVGGSKNSMHLHGLAADVSGPTVPDLESAANDVDAFIDGGIGLYRGRIHVDVRGTRARWDKRQPWQ